MKGDIKIGQIQSGVQFPRGANTVEEAQDTDVKTPNSELQKKVLSLLIDDLNVFDYLPPKSMLSLTRLSREYREGNIFKGIKNVLENRYQTMKKLYYYKDQEEISSIIVCTDIITADSFLKKHNFNNVNSYIKDVSSLELVFLDKSSGNSLSPTEKISIINGLFLSGFNINNIGKGIFRSEVTRGRVWAWENARKKDIIKGLVELDCSQYLRIVLDIIDSMAESGLNDEYKDSVIEYLVKKIMKLDYSKYHSLALRLTDQIVQRDHINSVEKYIAEYSPT